MQAEHVARKACMKCRQPLPQILRYGRVLNKSLLDNAEKKSIQVGGAMCCHVPALFGISLEESAHTGVPLQPCFAFAYALFDVVLPFHLPP